MYITYVVGIHQRYQNHSQRSTRVFHASNLCFRGKISNTNNSTYMSQTDSERRNNGFRNSEHTWITATMQLRNAAIGDSRLRPWVRNLAAPLGTSRWIIRYVTNSKSVCIWIWPLCENMTSSTKLEVNIVLHCHQRSNQPHSHVTSKEYFVKFGHVVFEI